MATRKKKQKARDVFGVGDVAAVQSGNLYRVLETLGGDAYRVIQLKGGEPWGPTRRMHASRMSHSKGTLRPQPRPRGREPSTVRAEPIVNLRAFLATAAQTLPDRPSTEVLRGFSAMFAVAAQLAEQ